MVSLPTITALGCATCAFLQPCGGLRASQGALFGCFLKCSNCGPDCDWACPTRPSEFVDRVREVGGLHSKAFESKALDPTPLGRYVPMIRHGFSRQGNLDRDVVALSINDLLKFKVNKYAPLESTAEGLRARFRSAASARVLVVSVAYDRVIERYWANRTIYNVPAALANLGLTAMTVPNFSFFTDGPRTQVLINRRRMEVVAEELSDAGVSFVPHLNALQEQDWEYWASFLRDHPRVTYVAKERMVAAESLRHRPHAPAVHKYQTAHFSQNLRW